jgi:hypothetical protein
MDLLILVFWICVIGFGVWVLTTKVFSLPPHWATAIHWGAFIVIALYLLRRFGPPLPNVLP